MSEPLEPKDFKPAFDKWEELQIRRDSYRFKLHGTLLTTVSAVLAIVVTLGDVPDNMRYTFLRWAYLGSIVLATVCIACLSWSLYASARLYIRGEESYRKEIQQCVQEWKLPSGAKAIVTPLGKAALICEKIAYVTFASTFIGLTLCAIFK